MKVAEGIEMLEMSVNIPGRTEYVCPVVFYNDEQAILVDASYPGQTKNLRKACTAAGISFDSINKIIITHHDIDHMGSLAKLVKTLPQGVEVMAHRDEKPYIEGDKPPAKWNPESVASFGAEWDSLPLLHRQAIKMLFENYHLLSAPVGRLLADGEMLPYCGGITVIHTPGHSPGHISLYVHRSRLLIAGDALFASEGALWATPPFLNLDQEQYQLSLRKLVEYDIDAVVCYHGGLYTNKPTARIAELALI